MVRELEKYSLKQLYDLLEILDVHDSLTAEAHEKAIADAKKGK